MPWQLHNSGTIWSGILETLPGLNSIQRYHYGTDDVQPTPRAPTKLLNTILDGSLTSEYCLVDAIMV